MINFVNVNNPGDSITESIYTAYYHQEAPPSTISTLNFVINPSLNGTNITCQDGGLPGNDMTCYYFVIGKLYNIYVLLYIVLL